jgi:hypothetical protein
LGADITSLLKVQKMDPPAKKEGGKKVESVQQLLHVLHTEAKVL